MRYLLDLELNSDYAMRRLLNTVIRYENKLYYVDSIRSKALSLRPVGDVEDDYISVSITDPNLSLERPPSGMIRIVKRVYYVSSVIRRQYQQGITGRNCIPYLILDSQGNFRSGEIVDLQFSDLIRAYDYHVIQRNYDKMFKNGTLILDNSFVFTETGTLVYGRQMLVEKFTPIVNPKLFMPLLVKKMELSNAELVLNSLGESWQHMLSPYFSEQKLVG